MRRYLEKRRIMHCGHSILGSVGASSSTPLGVLTKCVLKRGLLEYILGIGFIFSRIMDIRSVRIKCCLITIKLRELEYSSSLGEVT